MPAALVAAILGGVVAVGAIPELTLLAQFTAGGGLRWPAAEFPRTGVFGAAGR